MKRPIKAININPLPEPDLSPANTSEQETPKTSSASRPSLLKQTIMKIRQQKLPEDAEPAQPDDIDDIDVSYHMDIDSDVYSGFEIVVDLNGDADGDADADTDIDTDADTDINTKANTDIYFDADSPPPQASASLRGAKSGGSGGNRTSELMEHRLHTRIPMHKGIRFITKDAKTTTRAEMSDLSAGGVFIHTNELVEPGTIIACGFMLDDMLHRSSGVSIRATGKVIWNCRDKLSSKGRGFGVEFDKISRKDRAAISRLVDLMYVTNELRSLDEVDDDREARVPDLWGDSKLVRVDHPFETESTPVSASLPVPKIDMDSLPPIQCWGPEDSKVVLSGEMDDENVTVSGEIESSHTLRPSFDRKNEEEEQQQQRQHPRASIRLPIRFISKETASFINGKMADLSPGGVFICTDAPLDPGSVVACGFYLDSNRDQPNRTPIIAKGKVVWTSYDSSGDKGRGFGMQFLKISDESKQRITRAVQAHRAEPLAIATNGGKGKLVLVEEELDNETEHPLEVIPPENNDSPLPEEIQAGDQPPIPFINWCADERRYVRVSVQKPVRFFIRGSSDFTTAEMTDLSLGGMFIQTDVLLRPGTTIACALILHPMLDGPHKGAVLVKGKVIWTSYSDQDGKGRGFGIKFVKISSKNLQRIAQVVHERQGRRTATLRGW